MPCIWHITAAIMGIWARLELAQETPEYTLFSSCKSFNQLGIYILVGFIFIALMVGSGWWALRHILVQPSFSDWIMLGCIAGGVTTILAAGIIFSFYSKHLTMHKHDQRMHIKSRIGRLNLRERNIPFKSIGELRLENRNRWKEAPKEAFAKSGYWQLDVKMDNGKHMFVDRSSSYNEIMQLVEVIQKASDCKLTQIPEA